MSDNNNASTYATGVFIPSMSTNEIYYDTNMEVCLTDVLDGKAEVSHAHDGYAESTHTHSEYALQSDLELLEDVVNIKADSTHTHTEYAPLAHAHTDYASQVALDALGEAVATKADASHNHEGVYDESGAAANALVSANAYTDSKIDVLVGEGAAETLNTIGEISAAIEDNQDTIDLLNSAVGSKANANDLISHVNDSDIHISSAERTAWNAKSDFSGNYNDLTNKPTIPSIDGLATEDYVDDKVAAITVESIGALPDTTVIPTVPTNVSAFTNDAGYLTEHQSLVGLATETYVNTKIDAIDIPSALSDLSDDSTHRVVTDAEKTTWNAKSDFSGSYNDLTDKPSIPSVSGLATEAYVDEAVSEKADTVHVHVISDVTNLQSALDSKAASEHDHNSVYYTETEVNTLLSGKSDTTHNHNSAYDALGTAEAKANAALNSAEEYADEIVASEATARDTAIATAKSSAISTAASDASTKVNNHNTSTSAHSDIRTLIANLTTKLNNFLDVDDTTTDQLSEVITLINNNKGTLESLTTSKVNVSDIVDNLTTSNSSKVLSAKQGVAIKNLIDTLQNELDTHTHVIADVSGLQSALDGKAASSHGTHVTYSTTAPVMDGTASVGTATTVARSDHKHPTDTSRASQTDLDALETVVAGKAASSHTHTIANVTNLQSSLDAKQATVTGGASTITSSNLTANRALISNGSGKVAVSAVTSTELGYLDGVTSAIQTQLDNKSASSHTHKVVNITDLTATATELNYMDGVTSNVQTQLDGKAASGHTHNYAGSSSVGGSATSAVKLQTARTIALGTGATGTATTFDGTSNITIPVTEVKESYLSWGGKNWVGGVSPVGAALSPEHSANRIAYLNPNAVTIEYSNDAGSTWTDSGLADSSKINLVTTSNAVSVGSNSTVTTSHRTRMTLTAQDGTNSYVYTRPRKLLVNVSTPHGLTVTIEAKTGVSGASWTTLGTYSLAGWSGWNDIPLSISTFGGGTTQTGNYWYMRLTFANTSVNSSYTTTKSTIIGLRLFGDTCWTRTSNMGETGHLYSYDYAQNATFPASISGKGTLSMNRESGTTVGSYSVALGYNCESSAYCSHAEGDCTTASGLDAHSEGRGTTASGYHSHAQGIGTTASGTGSHAEGTGTVASGMYCHAEGASTTAKGYQTHAEGTGTIAACSNQHVQGTYNIEDTSYKYAHIIGNGDNSTRSNAHTVDWSGNAWYAGDVYVGGTSQSDGTKLVKSETAKTTITSLSSGWAVYGSTTTPTVRKFGNIISLTGALKNSSAVTLNTSQVQVFTIPEGYRPSQDLVVVCQGSGANRYALHVTTAGAVSIGRYGTTSFSEVSSGAWFPFHVTWVVD